jgi:YVTN family beta-propeller protein
VATRKTVKTLPAGKDPETFDVSPDGTRLYVSNEDADSASIVDLQSGKVIANVKTGREPEGVTLSPDGKTVWVTGETDHNITGIDTQSGKVIGSIEVGQRPRSIRFVQNGAKAYVTNEVAGTVTVVDMNARKTAEDHRMPEGSKPMGLAVRPTARRSTSRTVEAGLCRFSMSLPTRSSLQQKWGLVPGEWESRRMGRSSTRRTAPATMSR